MPTPAEVTAALIVLALGVIFVIALAAAAFLLADIAGALLDGRDRHSSERDRVPVEDLLCPERWPDAALDAVLADLAAADRRRPVRTAGERQHLATVTELYPETGRQVRRLPAADRRDGAA